MSCITLKILFILPLLPSFSCNLQTGPLRDGKGKTNKQSRTQKNSLNLKFDCSGFAKGSPVVIPSSSSKQHPAYGSHGPATSFQKPNRKIHEPAVWQRNALDWNYSAVNEIFTVKRYLLTKGRGGNNLLTGIIAEGSIFLETWYLSLSNLSNVLDFLLSPNHSKGEINVVAGRVITAVSSTSQLLFMPSTSQTMMFPFFRRLRREWQAYLWADFLLLVGMWGSSKTCLTYDFIRVVQDSQELLPFYTHILTILPGRDGSDYKAPSANLLESVQLEWEIRGTQAGHDIFKIRKRNCDSFTNFYSIKNVDFWRSRSLWIRWI